MSGLTPEEQTFLKKAMRKAKPYEPVLRAADPGLSVRLDVAEIIKGLRKELTVIRTEARKLQRRVYTLEQKAGIDARLRMSRK